MQAGFFASLAQILRVLKWKLIHCAYVLLRGEEVSFAVKVVHVAKLALRGIQGTALFVRFEIKLRISVGLVDVRRVRLALKGKNRVVIWLI